MADMPAQRDAETPARKIIHLHHLFDHKADAAQGERCLVGDDEAVTDRAAQPTGRD